MDFVLKQCFKTYQKIEQFENVIRAKFFECVHYTIVISEHPCSLKTHTIVLSSEVYYVYNILKWFIRENMITYIYLKE